MKISGLYLNLWASREIPEPWGKVGPNQPMPAGFPEACHFSSPLSTPYLPSPPLRTHGLCVCWLGKVGVQD